MQFRQAGFYLEGTHRHVVADGVDWQVYLGAFRQLLAFEMAEVNNHVHETIDVVRRTEHFYQVIDPIQAIDGYAANTIHDLNRDLRRQLLNLFKIICGELQCFHGGSSAGAKEAFMRLYAEYRF